MPLFWLFCFVPFVFLFPSFVRTKIGFWADLCGVLSVKGFYLRGIRYRIFAFVKRFPFAGWLEWQAPLSHENQAPFFSIRPECLSEALPNCVTVYIFITMWWYRFLCPQKQFNLTAILSPIMNSYLYPLNSHHYLLYRSMLTQSTASWRLTVFSSLELFLANFRSFRRLVYEDDGIFFD